MSEREKYPSEAAERFQVRLPLGLRDRIKEHAEAHGRSMNTEIVRVLTEAFPDPDTMRLSFEDVIMLTKAYEAATGTDVETRPITSEILHQVWQVKIGAGEEIAPKVRDALRAALDRVGKKG